MKHILKCPRCGKFTMKEVCDCGTKTGSTRPQRYSPGKYAKYRKEARKKQLEEKGSI